MPWLPLYLDAEDLTEILDYLNQHAEIAFIETTGSKSWKAVNATNSRLSRYCIWHTPSGDLPLLMSDYTKPPGIVSDPWNGWTEIRTGADPTTPYFGAGHHGIFWLNNRTIEPRHGAAIGLSSFEWIGNRYAKAHPATAKWWNQLRRWITKKSEKIPRTGPAGAPGAEIFALPGALEKIRQGAVREDNP